MAIDEAKNRAYTKSFMQIPEMQEKFAYWETIIWEAFIATQTLWHV